MKTLAERFKGICETIRPITDSYITASSIITWLEQQPENDLSVSSNGKITDSKSVDVGSIPTTGAKLFTIGEVEAAMRHAWYASREAYFTYLLDRQVECFEAWIKNKKQELMK